jgi:hypothetical protein
MNQKKSKNHFVLTDNELFLVWAPQHNDLVFFKQQIDLHNHEGSKRAYVRCLFSMIEGILFRIRQILVENNLKTNFLNPEQIIILKQISLELDDKGKIKTKDKFYEFNKMFRFTLEIFCKINNKHDVFMEFIADHKYQDFKNSIYIRNKLTHPKLGQDIFVTDNELAIVFSAGDWFHALIIELFKETLFEKTVSKCEIYNEKTKS